MKTLIVAVASVAGLLMSLSASAQFRKPEDAVEYRQAAFTLLGAHTGRLGAMVQGRVPFDAAAANANAELILTISKLPYQGFIDGTASTEKGGAKANIWTERAKFDAAAKKMQDEAVKLSVAAKTNNLDQIKAAFGPLGASCKACHDDFRNN